MAVETKSIRLNGTDYLLTKKSVEENRPVVLKRGNAYCGAEKPCIVEKLVLNRVEGDGTLKPVKTKEVFKPTKMLPGSCLFGTGEFDKDFKSMCKYITKSVAKEDLVSGEKSLVENIKHQDLYTNDLERIVLDIPGKASFKYESGLPLEEPIQRYKINFADGDVFKSFSNSAKRLIRILFR